MDYGLQDFANVVVDGEEEGMHDGLSKAVNEAEDEESQCQTVQGDSMILLCCER